ncbi:hypothetical protein FN846DRAFT_431626 [Sphaerosporella brunnea]|uniref:Uncharacterized protein n=1 Tax=Sphaerosporella brunnea TaxID=1250544 RepID=A0A5J5EF13_9PEZI|nr:hypothetical protein FN846DRAFT_431626 [Sphaerosporella brunnea]
MVRIGGENCFGMFLFLFWPGTRFQRFWMIRCIAWFRFRTSHPSGLAHRSGKPVNTRSAHDRGDRTTKNRSRSTLPNWYLRGICDTDLQLSNAVSIAAGDNLNSFPSFSAPFPFYFHQPKIPNFPGSCAMDRRRGAQGSPTVEDGDRARKRRKQSVSACCLVVDAGAVVGVGGRSENRVNHRRPTDANEKLWRQGVGSGGLLRKAEERERKRERAGREREELESNS